MSQRAKYFLMLLQIMAVDSFHTFLNVSWEKLLCARLKSLGTPVVYSTHLQEVD